MNKTNASGGEQRLVTLCHQEDKRRAMMVERDVIVSKHLPRPSRLTAINRHRPPLLPVSRDREVTAVTLQLHSSDGVNSGAVSNNSSTGYSTTVSSSNQFLKPGIYLHPQPADIVTFRSSMKEMAVQTTARLLRAGKTSYLIRSAAGNANSRHARLHRTLDQPEADSTGTRTGGVRFQAGPPTSPPNTASSSSSTLMLYGYRNDSSRGLGGGDANSKHSSPSTPCNSPQPPPVNSLPVIDVTPLAFTLPDTLPNGNGLLLACDMYMAAGSRVADKYRARSMLDTTSTSAMLSRDFTAASRRHLYTPSSTLGVGRPGAFRRSATRLHV